MVATERGRLDVGTATVVTGSRNLWRQRCGITSGAPPGRRHEAGGASGGRAGALEDLSKVSTEPDTVFPSR